MIERQIMIHKTYRKYTLEKIDKGNQVLTIQRHWQSQHWALKEDKNKHREIK